MPSAPERDALASAGIENGVAWLMVGHSSVLLQCGAVNLLFDPIWSDRCSPIQWAGPRRVRPPALTLEELPAIDLVLISHDHYDHCDRWTLEQLAARDDPRFVVGRGVGAHLRRWGIERFEELEWWQSAARGERNAPLDVMFVPARHFSGRGLSDRNRSLWGGFWIRSQSPVASVYFCGDTGFAPAQTKEIRRRLGAPDLSFLPIGAYAPRWFMRPVHLDPEEAVSVHELLGSKRSVGMHCETFQLTDEPMEEPAARLRAECLRRGVSEDAFSRPHFGRLERLS